MADEEHLRKTYADFQMTGEHIKQLEANLERITEKKEAIGLVKTGLDELQKTEKGTHALVPLAEGIFMKSQIVETHRLVMNVGADVCIEKSVEDVRKLLEKRLDELDAHHAKGMQKMQELNAAAQDLQNELLTLVNEQ